MARFEIKGKEYELKLTFKSVKHLDALFEGGSLVLVGKAISGELDTFTHVIHAGLFHTDENISLKDVEKALEDAFNEEKLDLEYVMKTCNEVVTESFFYKKVVTKLMKENPKAVEAIQKILN